MNRRASTLLLRWLATATTLLALAVPVTSPVSAQTTNPCENPEVLWDPAQQVPEQYNDPNLVYVGVTVVDQNGLRLDTVPDAYKTSSSNQVIVLLATTRVVNFRLECDVIVQFTFVKKGAQSVPNRRPADHCDIEWQSMTGDKPADGYHLGISGSIDVSGPGTGGPITCGAGQYPFATLVNAATLSNIDTAEKRAGNRTLKR